MIFRMLRNIFRSLGSGQDERRRANRDMTVFESKTPLAWGELDVPLLGLSKDWNGELLQSPAGFSLAVDGRRLWFVATHRTAASLHPQSRPGKFQTGLWEHDVAELFLASPDGCRYFEFNLAPNGAWWTCEFKGPRQREEDTEIAMPEIATFSELAPDGGWVAAMAIPLDLLRARIDFGPRTLANVTFILGHPKPRYLSATDLGSGEPDFHRPGRFAPVRLTPIPA